MRTRSRKAATPDAGRLSIACCGFGSRTDCVLYATWTSSETPIQFAAPRRRRS
jgi:hypothetical protein